MSKRRNENGQMRREEFEAANERDGDASGDGDFMAGGFTRASEDAIRGRKIVVARAAGGAKRPAAAAMKPAAPVAAAPVAGGAKSNPFSGFSGLTSATTTTTAAPAAVKPNPFAGFSGLTSANGSAAAPAASSVSSRSAPPPANYQEAIEVLNKEFLDFASGQLQKNPTSDWTAAVQDYVKHAQQIGTKFASTKPVPAGASAAASARPPAAATAGTPAASAIPSFLNAPKKADSPAASSGFSFGNKKETPPPATTTTTSTTGGFSFGNGSAATKPAVTGGFAFGNSSASTEAVTSAAPAAAVAAPTFSFAPAAAEPKAMPAFSFGYAPSPVAASKPAASTTSSGFSFGGGVAAASTSGFSFNVAKPTTTAAAPAPSGGFSFSLAAPAAPTTSAPAPFSFGSTLSAPPASSSAAAAGGADAEEDEENIGREEATVILKSDNPDEECTFEADKAKILEFKKDEKRWADKGTHPLKVLINATTKNARLLVRNEIGKIVLNSALYKGLAVKPQEAKGKKTGALLSLQVDGSLTQFIIKVNSAKVDAMISAVEKATPK